ncbi:MAG: deoxyribonuclease IV [Phycisphaerae bacterium]|nr:deoxyribonuclease IV [Phycisphaerae bacterium]
MTQKFGSHVSAAGGLQNAFTEAVRVGCDCLQIFVKNQRQWAAPPLNEEQIANYRRAERDSRLGPVFAHATYLLNLATPDETLRTKSVAALVDELQRCESLGLQGLVVHPGAHVGTGEVAGIAAIARSLNEVHKRTSGFKCPVLLETTAGQGTTLGNTIEQIAAMLGGVDATDRLGVCLDTCHLFAAGYDLTDPHACAALVDRIDSLIGVDRVLCIHTNDSKGKLGSRLDRHEHIGKGLIGKRGFANLLNDARLTHVPRILETPKGEDERGRDWDRVNLGVLRRITGTTRGAAGTSQ